MSTHHNLADTFSIFHDGTITDWSGDRHHLRLTIECEYLAELIDPTFDTFFVELFEIDFLEFEPWPNPADLPVVLKTDLHAIFLAELEILHANEKENGCVEIVCNQHDSRYDYCGGRLLISCLSVSVTDQLNNPLTIDELDIICNRYWNRNNVQ